EWEAAQAGVRRVVLVAGEPGIGKTRLACGFARRVHDGGADGLYGRADEEPLAPYPPPAEALPGAFHGKPGATSGPAGGRVTSCPAGARYRLFEAVAASLARSRPVLLVLDDLHWLDAPTARLLRHIAVHDPAPLLVLGTYREAEGSAPLADLAGELRRDGLLT